jgi:hypothetical protein
MINKRTFLPRPRKYVQTISAVVPIQFLSHKSSNFTLSLEWNDNASNGDRAMHQLEEARQESNFEEKPFNSAEINYLFEIRPEFV